LEERYMKRVLVLMVVIAFASVSTSYSAIEVGNAGFDDAPIVDNWAEDLTPWQTLNEGGGWAAWISENYYAGEPPTVPAIYTTGDHVWQDLSAAFAEGETYEFSIDVGTSTGGDFDWTIYIYDVTTGYTSPLATESGVIPGESQWYRQSVSYTATAAEADHNIGIGFTGGYYAMFDNASVIPEPATLCLLGLGALMFRRRRA
jgi:hypothetical protein